MAGRRVEAARVDELILVTFVVGLTAGAVEHAVGNPGVGDLVWTLTASAGLVPATWWVAAAAWQRRLGVDVVAILALAGTLVIGEPLAGALIAVMLATGRALEAHAAARASRELRMLLERAPRRVSRYEDGVLADRPVEDVRPGDVLLVKPGEVIPVDGAVVGSIAVIDESAVTGESMPVDRLAGDNVRSGTVNAGAGFDLRATTTSAESTYTGIVRLVADAKAGSAQFIRLADRYAGLFLVLSLVLATGAWALSGSLERAVAVLVVATPCPLILAAPVAIVAGMSRAAERGVVVKGGAALEQLARASVLLFDKTGTLTAGRPSVTDVTAWGRTPASEVLRLSASLDQFSPHVLAGAIVAAAIRRGLHMSVPTEVNEVPGRGITGIVDGRHLSVGKAGSVRPDQLANVRAVRRRSELDGSLTVFVEIDGSLVGAILLDDPIRPDAARTIRRLRSDGISRVVMVTGDREEVARGVGAVIGVDDVLAERTPAEKVDAVRLERRWGPTIMVGDGINDAPALAMADVGVAIGARGSTASSEAADVVLNVDRLDRLGDAIVIARRSRRIAQESVVAGIGMSVVAMLVASAGRLPPAWGALLQEGIDVAVIVNALRARAMPSSATRLTGPGAELARRFSAEHRLLWPDISRVRVAADALGTLPATDAMALVRDVHNFLVEDVQPHEEAEDAELYPVLAKVLGGTDPTGTMSRAHVEIAHHIRRLGRLLDDVDPVAPDDADLAELRRLLYGLHAILRLHFAQEDEGYLSLADDDVGVGSFAGPTGTFGPAEGPLTTGKVDNEPRGMGATNDGRQREDGDDISGTVAAVTNRGLGFPFDRPHR